MNPVLKILTWVTLGTLAVGFRVSPGKWNITKEDPTIWLRVCAGAVDTSGANNLPSDDPLAHANSFTITQILQSVIDDYNNAPTAFLRLAMYPADPNNPGAPLTGDSAFTIEKAATRTIDICFDGTDPSAGLSAGHARTKLENGNIVSCEVKTKSGLGAKDMRFFISLITHELGHCFSLQHPQESVNSVMSYFDSSGGKVTRLQNDDIAGLTFLYPEDPSYADEAMTFGLKGCSPN